MVTAITGAASQAHRYPDPLAGALRAELAALHGVHPDQILVGNGSDELIFLGTLAQAEALAALGDPGHAAQVRARTLRARAELTRLFEHARYPVIPSQANFILVQAPDEHALVSRLAEHAITVRPGTALGIPGTVRVSVPSQRGLRLLHSALRPTPGRPQAESC